MLIDSLLLGYVIYTRPCHENLDTKSGCDYGMCSSIDTYTRNLDMIRDWALRHDIYGWSTNMLWDNFCFVVGYFLDTIRDELVNKGMEGNKIGGKRENID